MDQNQISAWSTYLTGRMQERCRVSKDVADDAVKNWVKSMLTLDTSTGHPDRGPQALPRKRRSALKQNGKLTRASAGG